MRVSLKIGRKSPFKNEKFKQKMEIKAQFQNRNKGPIRKWNQNYNYKMVIEECG